MNIVEIHFPLGSQWRDDEDYSWIDSLNLILMNEDGSGGQFLFDDGEEVTLPDGSGEYVFFVGGNPMEEMLTFARAILGLPGVPKGGYLTRNTPHGAIGEGERIV